jgi:3-oxoacyl-[acyl-carrier protein] reductase
VKPRALVTGAARGIGAAIALELAREGYPVILNYRADDSAAQDTKARIEAGGGSVTLWRRDVREREAVTSDLEALLAGEENPIGVLVNNAGITRDAPFPVLAAEDWTDVTRTTLDGFFNVTQPLVMAMVRRRAGRIVNIASVSALIGNRGQVNYSAAKAGLVGATRSLAQELAKRNVTVNAVAPGLIETDMTKGLPLEEILSRIPMRRLGKPEEVAALVRFLVSEEAAYITGQVIGINGGLA